MRYLILSIFLIWISSQGFSQDTIKIWNEFQKQHLKNQADTASWSKELLQRDIDDSIHNKNFRPFPNGAFPVPKYELAGFFRYKGGGVNSGTLPNYYGKMLKYHVYVKNKTEATKEILKEKPNEAFFVIVTLTNLVDTLKGANSFSFFLSRNNPDVICEGFFKAQNDDEVSYMAFLTGNRDEFAVVNMKLFNLRNGSTVLVAPQKDHSLRFMQIPTPILSRDEVRPFLNRILEEEKVKAFFLDSGSL